MFRNFGEVLGKFGKLRRNFVKFWEFLPQFTRLHVEKNWAQKFICGEKNDKYEVCPPTPFTKTLPKALQTQGIECFNIVDCPTQLTLYDLDLSVVFHDKYQWEIWKNTAGKSASFNVTLPKQMNFRKSSNWPIFFLNNHNWSAATRECRLSWAWAWKWLLFA